MEINILAHTHWDREWYFNHSRSLIYSLHDFDELIEYLESNEKFKCFILDGQSSIIEDYLEIHPHMEKRLKKLIKDKRIFTGPWYSQPDTLIITGESIVRNLLYGSSMARKLGHSMEVGYLPDSFGMSEQMPQIYSGFDLKYAMFHRGKPDFVNPDREFIWKSRNGSSVFTHNIYHYGSMAFPPEEDDKLKDYISKMRHTLESSTKTGVMVLFNGEDQKPIRQNLPEIIERMNIVGKELGIEKVEQVSPKELMKKLSESDYDFKEYEGELTFGQHSRVHKSIFSTRADLKIKHHELENYLANVLEPMSVIAADNGIRYEEELIEKIWKLCLDNTAHDSIGMCNSDLTNSYIANRRQVAYDLATNHVELLQRKLAGRIQSKDFFQFQVYNLDAKRRSACVNTKLYLPSENVEIVNSQGKKCIYNINNIKDVTEDIFKLSAREVGVSANYNAQWVNEIDKIFEADISIFIPEIISCGYETFYVKTCEDKICKNREDVQLVEKDFIENEYLKVSFDKGINVKHKASGKIWTDLISFEDGGDDGDSYDYSEPFNDVVFNDFDLKLVKVLLTGIEEKMELEVSLLLPFNLSERSLEKRTVILKSKLTLTLQKGSDVLGIDLDVENTALEHRFRMLVNTGISSKKSFASQQFGTIERDVEYELENWREEGWKERPRTIEPMQDFVALRSDDASVEVISKAVREYQIVGKDFSKIAMTVFRSFSYLGKAELQDRPGRASGKFERSPDGELYLKTIHAKYGIKFYCEKASAYDLSQSARKFVNKPLIYQGADFKNNTDYFVIRKQEPMDLGNRYSFVELDGKLILSALKKSMYCDDFILRVFNPDRDVVSEFSLVGVEVDSRITLDERRKEEAEIFKLKPCEAGTYLIKR